jgi:hypothetical protein
MSEWVKRCGTRPPEGEADKPVRRKVDESGWWELRGWVVCGLNVSGVLSLFGNLIVNE